ncbi:AMP-binding protein [Bradyrhizobium sp. 13971]
MTIPQLLNARRAERAEAVAYKQKRRGEWIAVTWRQYSDQVANLAAALQQAGFERGDRAAIMGDVSQEWLLADMATICAGGVMVGVYFTSSAEEVAYYLSDSGASFIFVGRELQLGIVLASGQAEQLRKIIVLDPDWNGAMRRRTSFLSRTFAARPRSTPMDFFASRLRKRRRAIWSASVTRQEPPAFRRARC